MQYLAVFFASIAGSLAKRVLVALGIGLVSYAVFGTVAHELKDAVRTALGSMSGVAFDLAGLSGFFDAIGIWFGAITAVVTIRAGSQLARISE